MIVNSRKHMYGLHLNDHVSCTFKPFLRILGKLLNFSKTHLKRSNVYMIFDNCCLSAEPNSVIRVGLEFPSCFSQLLLGV